MSKSLCILFVIFLLCLHCCAVCAEEQPVHGITVFVYMTGSDLETYDGAASRDINEMLAADFDENEINVVIMTGGAEHWEIAQDPDSTVIYRLRRNRSGNLEYRRKDTLDSLDMGDASTLSMFLNYGVEAFPAREYALILWNHGGGPIEGVCRDDVFNKDWLSLEELDKALSESPFSENPLRWIGFDACLMASIETASVCAPYAEYMIASQETEPVYGWNYSFLKDLRAGMSGAEVGEIIVKHFVDHQKDKLMQTLSCIDLSRVEEINNAIGNMFDTLGSQLTISNFTSISNDRRSTKSFGRVTTSSDYDLTDMYDLSEKYTLYAPKEATELQEILKEAIICADGNQENAHGLSIYSPFYNKNLFVSEWKQKHETWNITPRYSEFLNKYSQIWLGEQLGDWSLLNYHALSVDAETDSQEIIFELSEEQMNYFASAKIEILQYTGFEDTYRKIYEYGDLTPVNHTLRFVYDFSMLYAMNESGDILTYPLSFETVDGYIILTPELIDRSNADLERDYQEAKISGSTFVPGKYAYTILRCKPDEQGVIEIDGFSLVNEEEFVNTQRSGLLAARETDTINTSIFHYLDFNRSIQSRKLQRNADGTCMPYDSWINSDYRLSSDRSFNQSGKELNALEILINRNTYEFGMVRLDRAWTLSFVKADKKDRTGLYAQFIITDSQGNEIASELIPLNQDNTIAYDDFNKEIYADSAHNVSVALNSVTAIRTENGVELHLAFVDQSPQNFDVVTTIRSIEINGIKVNSHPGPFTTFKSAETECRVFDYFIKAQDLPEFYDETIKRINIKGEIRYPDRDSDNNSSHSTLVNFEKQIETDFYLGDFLPDTFANIQVETPEDPEQYNVTLSAAMTQEQIQKHKAGEIENIEVVLLSSDILSIDSNDYYQIYFITQTDTAIENDKISVTIPGLLLRVKGAERPMFVNYIMSEQAMTMETWLPFEIKGYKSQSYEKDYTCSSCVFSLDYKTDSTSIISLEGGARGTNGKGEPMIVANYPLISCNAVQRIGEATEADFLIMQDETRYLDNQPLFELIPVSEMSPLVIYVIDYRDGTSSILQIPYADAVNNHR